MKPLDHAALADALLPAVLAAGRIEMRHFAAGVAVAFKPDASPVTAADTEAEAVLLDGLWRAARGVPVIAEESATLGVAPACGASYFLVDPLDGTREFAKRRQEFTINIGLVVGEAPAFGLIYAPALQALYVTLGTGRAVETRIAPDAEGLSLTDCTLAEIRTREPDPGALVALESRSHRTEETDSFLARYRVAHVKYAGSSLKFCLIARGEADFYARLGPTREWDTAAGHAILSAAGGTVTTVDGAPLQYSKSEQGFLNPHFEAWGRRPLPPIERRVSSI
jgi:3'(2'), 5'-bisphosphate nucleotidase